MVIYTLVVASSAILLATASAQASPSFGWKPDGTISPSSLEDVSCAGPLCVAVGGSGTVAATTDPIHATWSSSSLAFGGAIHDVSCASSTMCVAVGAAGNVAVSTNPGAGPWAVSNVGGSTPIWAVSCPTTSFCVAVDDSGNALVSTNPAGGSWTSHPIDSGKRLNDISCPSTTFCMAVDETGSALSSSNPGAPSPTWLGGSVDSGALTTVSCASATFCAVGAASGTIYTLIDDSPWASHAGLGVGAIGAIACVSRALCVASGSNAKFATSGDAGANWAVSSTPSSSGITGLSCPSVLGCVAVDSAGAAFNGGRTDLPVWGAPVPTGAGALSAMSCVSSSFCVGGGGGGKVVTSTNPLAASPPWSVATVAGANTITAMSCPSTTLCVGGDDQGNIVSSTSPLDGATAWAVNGADPGHGINSVSCPTTTLCVAGDANGSVLTSTSPASSSWTVTPLGTGGAIKSVSCPLATMCAAADSAGNVIVSTNPPGGAGAWATTNVDYIIGLTSVSCRSTTFCVATDQSAQALVSTNPTAAPPTWTSPYALPGSPSALHAIGCASDFCVAVGAVGAIETSPDPVGGPSAWRPDTRGANLMAVSCPGGAFCIAADDGGNVVAGNSPAAPQNLTAPTASGSATPGGQLDCSNGTWSGWPIAYSFTYEWLVDGAVARAASPNSGYTVQSGDQGHSLSCRVAATNVAGKATATSNALPVPAASTPTGPATDTSLPATTTTDDVPAPAGGGSTTTPPPPPRPLVVNPPPAGKYSVDDLATTGVPLTVSCSEACTITTTVLAKRALARQLHIAASQLVVVATGTARLRRAGSVKLVVKLTKAARKKLRAHAGSLWLFVCT